jgi:hypothetical protein
MAAHVGGRFEEVAPKPILLGADYLYLALLLAFSVALHGRILCHSTMTARDGMEFARYVAHLHRGGPPAEDGRPAWLTYIQSANHPPGYPAAVLAVMPVVSHFSAEPYHEQLLTACKLASALAGVLLVFPTYRLGRGLFGTPFAGFAAAALFQAAPTVAQITSDGLSESLFLLLTASALACGVRAMRRASTLWCLLCGLASGLAYLVRPEGAIVVLAVGAAVAGQGILGRWPRTAAMGRMTALAVGLMLVAVPYAMLIGKLTNKPNPGGMLQKLGDPFGSKLRSLRTGGSAAVAGPALFADWYEADRDGEQAAWAAKAIAKETFKSSHYAPFVLAVLGLVIRRKQAVTDPGLMAVLALAAGHAALLFALGMRQPDPGSVYGAYISERHTLLLVLVVSLLAAGALEPIARAFSIRPVFLLLGLVASMLPSATKPLHENRLGFYHAGHFLATQNLGPTDAVIDPFSWAEWYAGRTLYEVPPDPAEPTVRWAILDAQSDDHHSRLPRLQDALNVKNDGKDKPQLVYWWPEVPAADAEKPPKEGGSQVRVYRQVVPKSKKDEKK